MTTMRFVLADVFTDKPLAGNQLAVFLDGDAIDEELLQPLARELNLSETVFVYPASDSSSDARIRLFSTVTELPFAGHPMLGTAAVLAQVAGSVPNTTRKVRLETGRGIVPVEISQSQDGVFTGWMDQPIPTIEPWDHTEELLQVLGLSATELPIEVYDNGIPHLYVTAADSALVAAIVPNFPALGRVCAKARINCLAGSGSIYTSRMFSPFDYVPEDPACGSAAGPLAVHLLRHGRIKAGQQITISQGEQVGRPSTLYATVYGAPDHIERVTVGGTVRLVGSGEFVI